MGRSQREHELYQKWGDVKTSYTPEEVSKIEDAAYENGRAVGAHEEYKRIMYLIDKLEETDPACHQTMGALIWTSKLESMIKGE